MRTQEARQDPLQTLTLDQALTKVGASNYYQYRAFIYFGLQWFFAKFISNSFISWILISPIYIFKMPDVMCGTDQVCAKYCPTIDSFGDSKTCYDYICSMSYESRSDLLEGQSLVLAFESQLICKRENYADLLRSMPYFGSLVGFFIFSFIADNFGRKYGIGLSWFCASIGALILGIAINFEMIGIGMFLTGFGVNPAITIQYSLFNEHTLGNFRDVQNIGVQVFFGVGEIVIVIIAYYFRDWRDLTLYWFFIPLFIMNFGIFLFYESPKFLYGKSKFKAVGVLNKIAKVNGREQLQLEELEDCVNQTSRVYSFVDLIRFQSLRLKFICGVLMFFSLQVVYYGINFAMDNIGLSLYYNAFIVACFETLSFIIADNYIVIIRRKRSIFTGLLLSCVLSFLFIFLQPPSDCGLICGITIIQIIMAGLIRFVICFVMGIAYTYIPELFPTPVRAQGMSLISAAGTIGSICCPFLITLSRNIGIQPLISLGIVGLVGVIAILPLKETLNQPMLEEIEEFQEYKLINQSQQTLIALKKSDESMNDSQMTQSRTI